MNKYFYERVRMFFLLILALFNTKAGKNASSQNYLTQKQGNMGFPGGTGVKNPPANAGDTGLSPGPGRSHMPWSN